MVFQFCEIGTKEQKHVNGVNSNSFGGDKIVHLVKLLSLNMILDIILFDFWDLLVFLFFIEFWKELIKKYCYTNEMTILSLPKKKLTPLKKF